MSRIRTGVKWLLLTLAGILVLAAVLIGALLAALRSEAGTAWVLEQIPGLETTAAEGSLLGVWQAEAVHWTGYGIDLKLNGPYLDWSPTCLLQGTLCLERLHVGTMALNRIPGEETGAEAGAIELPTVRLPLDLAVEEVQLGRFELDGTLVWDEFSLSARGGGTDWHFRSLHYARDTVVVDVEGRVDTRGDWPLALNVTAQLPPPYGERWHIDADISGSVRDLRLAGVSEGYLDAEFDGGAEPLDSGLPLRLNVTSERFLALDTLPPTLTLEDWRLQLDGSLARGIDTRLRASLPGQQETIGLDLSALVTTERARNLDLQLTTPRRPEQERGQVSVTGEVSWVDGINADARGRLRAFPWYDLIPGLEPPPVQIRTLDLDASYRDGSYQARLEATTDGPLGATDLSTSLAGDLSRVTLTELSASTGAGGLSGNAELAFAGPLVWEAAVTLEDFNPGYWVPELEASIDGDIHSQGEMAAGGQPDLTASWDLDGEWRSAPLLARGQLDSRAGVWNVPELIIRVADNEAQGSGRWAGDFAADLNLDIPDPGVLLPGLSGTLRGEVTASGTRERPVASVRLQGSELAWQDLATLDTLSLEADLAEDGRAGGTLAAGGLLASGQTLEALTLDLDGDLKDHRVTIRASNDDFALLTEFAGGWTGAWEGALARGELELPRQDQSWRLDSAAALVYRPDGELTLGAHCWRWQDSSLCAGDQTLLPNTALDYQLSELPASILSPLLPETLRWQASINGSIAFTLAEEGPRGQIRLDAGPGELEVLSAEEWVPLGYDELTAELAMEPEQARVALFLAGDDLGLGGLSLNMTVDPRAEGMPMTGNYGLEAFDLALLASFLDLENMGGQLNGAGRLSGPLMDPEVRGDLVLDDGYLLDSTVPMPIEELTARLRFEGRSANLEGSWRSNGEGTGEITGDLSWADGPDLALQLTGQRLPVTYEPYARLELAPDLTLTFSNGDLAVKGRVDVPRGSIEVQELPAQAVSVSEDEVIVGAEAQEPTVRTFNMDVQVQVGADRVTFDGFGVTGNLQGGLRIGNNMDTRGTLQLTDGRYEAYGQELELRRARLVFVGPVTQPYLDVEAIRRVDQVVAGLRITGPVSGPQTEVFSEPPMSQNAALSYVILGRPPGQSAGDDNQMSKAALSLGLTQASKLTRGVGEEFGIRDLTLEAEGSGDEASVVASGQITDELSLRYGVGIFEPVTTVALRYKLGQYIYLEAASGLASSLDLFYTRNF